MVHEAGSSCHSPGPASRPNAASRISVRRAGCGPRTSRSRSTSSWPARRRATNPGGGASPWRTSSAMPVRGGDTGRWRASIAPARFPPSSPRTSTTCIRPQDLPRNTWSNCTAIRPTPPASTATRATNFPGCGSGWMRRTAARRTARLRRLYQDRDRLVRSGHARCRYAARPRPCAVIAICFWRSARRSWSGRRPAFR